MRADPRTSNEPYANSVVGAYLNKNAPKLLLDGSIKSEHFRKLVNANTVFVGREIKVSPGLYDRVDDDIQHQGYSWKANGSTYFVTDDVSTGRITRSLHHYLVYISSSMAGQAMQTLASMDFDNTGSAGDGTVQVQLDTGSQYLRVQAQGSYSGGGGLWRYNINNITDFKLNDWNWISVYVDELNQDGVNQDDTNTAFKVWVNGKQQATSSSTSGFALAQTGGVQTGNTTKRLKFFRHAASGQSPTSNTANNLSVQCIILDSLSETGKISKIHSGFDLEYFKTFPHFFLAMEEDRLEDYGSSGSAIALESIANPLTGFFDDTRTTEFSVVNQRGYNNYRAPKLSGSADRYYLSSGDIHGGLSGNSLVDYLAIQIVCRTSSASFQQMIAQYDNATSDTIFAFRVNSDGSFQVIINPTSGSTPPAPVQSSGVDVADGKIHRLTFVLDYTGGFLRLYADGTQVANSLTPTQGSASTAHQIAIGGLGDLAAQLFNGEIYEVSIFGNSNTISSGDLSQFARTGKSSNDPSFKWEFKDRQALYASLFGINNAVPQTTVSEITSTIIPASLTNSIEDVLGTELYYKGTLAPRLQLKNAGCVKLNATDQSIDLTTQLANQASSDVTHAFKLKIPSGAVNLTPIASGSQYTLLRWSDSNTTLRIRGNVNSAETTFTFPESIRTGEYQDVLVCHRGSDNFMCVYIDGVQNTEGYQATTGASSFTIDSLGKGSSLWGDIEFAFFGRWNRAFTQWEIDNFRYHVPDKSDSVIFYTFSEIYGAKVIDHSSNSNDGTVSNPILSTIRDTQDFFHWNYINGYWTYTDVSENEAHLPVDKGATTNIGGVTFNRGSFVDRYNSDSDIECPDIPEVPREYRGVTILSSELDFYSRRRVFIEVRPDRGLLLSNKVIPFVQTKRGGYILDQSSPLMHESFVVGIDFTDEAATTLNGVNFDALKSIGRESGLTASSTKAVTSTAMNGRRVAQFASQGIYFLTEDFESLKATAARTLIFAFRPSNPASSSTLMTINTNNVGDGVVNVIQITAEPAVRFNGANRVFTGLTINEDYVLVVRNPAGATNLDFTMRANGVELAEAGVSGNTLIHVESGVCTFGDYLGSPNSGFTGIYAEAYAYAAMLSDSQVAEIEAHLKLKYSIA